MNKSIFSIILRFINTDQSSWFLLIPAGLWLCLAMPTSAQVNKEPDELKGVEITEHLNVSLPLDLTFKNSEEKEIPLRSLFRGDRPVILTLVYYRCPMLCGLLLDGLIDGMKRMNLTAGKDFDIITASFDPLETPAMAQVNKQRLVKSYGRPEANAGWYFLTGKPENITKLADTVGFGYKWNEQRKEYAHVAVVMICTPDGRLSRYLYGIQFDPSTLRLSLVEASQGKTGSTVDKLLLTCFQYDPHTNRYAVAAMNFMRLAAVLTILILGGFLGRYWRKERQKIHQPIAEGKS